MQFQDFYKVLQVDPSAEAEVIVVAYKRLALKYHPNTNPDSSALERMQEINRAYKILSDPIKRREFDKLREEQLKSVDAHGPKEKNRVLVYQSNFLMPSPEWTEHHGVKQKGFRRSGYFHMFVSTGPDENDNEINLILPFQMKNFRLYFDAQVSDESSKETGYGVLFRVRKIQDHFDYYQFGVGVTERTDDNERPTVYLSLTKNKELYMLTDFIESSAINSRKWHFDNKISDYVVEREYGWAKENKHLVDVKDNVISVGVNGKILARVNNSELLDGHIGFFVNTMFESTMSEVRFRNIRIYSQ
jgi:curved DNA-binding protein CbpA